MADSSQPWTYAFIPLYTIPSRSDHILYIILHSNSASCLANDPEEVWFLTPFLIGGFCKMFTILLSLNTNNIICLIFDFVGYACRSSSARSPPGHYSLMPSILQNAFIRIVPALFAATIYMILGQIIRLTDGEKHSVVQSSKITEFFVSGDIFCFCLQAGGKCLHLVHRGLG